jgi:signal transduction histidine kinase
MAIDETTALLRMNIDNKNIRFLNNVPKNLVIQADYNMVNTILRNLISNAVKFSHEGKEIEIETTDHDDSVKVSVKDYGVGIPQEDQEKLFRIGHNITKNGTANEKGTGLGLLVCKEFVERHGGRIWLESTPFEGTTFYFTLPKNQNKVSQ